MVRRPLETIEEEYDPYEEERLEDTRRMNREDERRMAISLLKLAVPIDIILLVWWLISHYYN